jgi:4-carboxymuconolactone decarboxylase
MAEYPDAKARFTQLGLDELVMEQRALAERILGVSSVGIGGPYNLLLRSPVLGDRMFDLLHYLRWNTSLPLKLNEFAILIVGLHWRSQVEWYAHRPIAIKAGLSPDLIEELKSGIRPKSMPEEEAVVFDFATELMTGRTVSEATFERAKRLFSEQQIVDLTAIVGTYVTIAMLLEMAKQGVPDGAAPPFGNG